MPGADVPSDAWSQVVSAVLDARADPASVRFDEELAAAQAAGLPAEAARALRYWQRASVRAALDHARTAVPAVVGALTQSAADAVATIADQDQAWRAAVASVAADATVSRVAPDAVPVAPPPSSAPPAPSRLDAPRRLLVAGLSHLPDAPQTSPDPRGTT